MLALVLGLAMVLLLPSAAFAARTKYGSSTPTPNSSTSDNTQRVSVKVYDREGVSSAGGGSYYMSVDGSRVRPRIYRYRGYGNRYFKLTYDRSTPYPDGLHRVFVKIRDNQGNYDRRVWFWRVDTVAPVTTPDVSALPKFPGLFIIGLTATDAGSGVAATYWQLDAGPVVEGTMAWGNLANGAHTLKYWSVDKTGNIEATKTLTTVVGDPHATPASSCSVAGCHSQGLTVIHQGADNPCGVCHAAGVTPTNNCRAAACHVVDPHAAGGHPVIASVGSTPACTLAGCHGTSVVPIHPTCATCHASANPAVTAVVNDKTRAATCEDCHGTNYPHPGAGAAHANPASSCNAAGCHNDPAVDTMHAGTASSCTACHKVAPGYTLTKVCATCHPSIKAMPGHTNADHVSIPSTSTPGCTEVTCHGTGLLTTATEKRHDSCAVCHGDPAVWAKVVPGATKCETCHTATHATIHAGGNTAHVWGDATAGCSRPLCHPADAASVHTAFFDPPGCAACHTSGASATTVECSACHTTADRTAAHNYAHTILTPGITANSPVCASCHGSDIRHVGSRATIGGALHVPAVPAEAENPFISQDRGEHKGCSCHAYGDNDPAITSCTGCHAPHGFSQTIAPWNTTGTWVPAGGHNTPLFDVNGATSDFSATGLVVKDSMENTITQEWPLPTSGVFWSDSKGLALNGTVDGSYSLNPTDAPSVALANKGFTGDPIAAIRTDVGWGSVITCYDCHTGLQGLAGPQGANVANYGLDPNFPDDWTRAEITSFDPTGMRSIETTRGMPNPYYPKWGSLVNMGASEIVTQAINGVPSSVTTIYPGGFYKATANSGSGYSAAVKTGRFICQKCHKLTNSFQGLGIEGNGRGFRSNNMNYMGFSNEAHMEHHADMVTGQGNCVSCHISIPHGWKRPRLLVYESDPAPYKVQHYLPNYWLGAPSSEATATNPDLSQGNWGWLGGGTTLYKQVGAAIPNGSVGATSTTTGVWSNENLLDGALPQGTVVNNSGKTYSSHLEKIAASATAHKELVVGPADMFRSNDTSNGTVWGKWLATAEGSEWHPDTSPNALYSGEAIQNNCTACTSAGLTHSDTGGTSEGVAETSVPGRTQVGGSGTWAPVPYWK